MTVGYLQQPVQNLENLHEALSRSPLLDAFDRLRTSAPVTLMNSKQLRSEEDGFNTAETNGANTTATLDLDRASTILAVAAEEGTRCRQTKRHFDYQPGKSQVIEQTQVFGAAEVGITRRVGFYDDDNGLFFEQDIDGIRFVIRSSVTGSPVDTKYEQADWNIDTMDGRGITGITLDMTKASIFFIDFEWLGVGSVAFGYVINRRIVYAHIQDHANLIDSVYMSNPNLPVRQEIINDGDGGAATLEVICSSVISEGGVDDHPLVTRVATNHDTHVDCNAIGTAYALIGIQLKASQLWQHLDIESIDLLGSTTNDFFHWELRINPTVEGVFTYADLDNTAVQVAYGALANTVTGGTSIASGFGSSQISVSHALGHATHIGHLIDGTPETLVLTAMPIIGINQDIYSSLTWTEIP